VDSTFVRNLSLSDDELALILSHEAAHVVCPARFGEALVSCRVLGKEKAEMPRGPAQGDRARAQGTPRSAAASIPAIILPPAREHRQWAAESAGASLAAVRCAPEAPAIELPVANDPACALPRIMGIRGLTGQFRARRGA